RRHVLCLMGRGTADQRPVGSSPANRGATEVRDQAMEAQMNDKDRLNIGDPDRMRDEKPRMVTGSFRDHEAAERAYDIVTRRGYDAGEIHVIMSDETRKRNFGKDLGND